MGPLSTVYSGILSIRKFFYKVGLKTAKKLPSKVISIGNLTLGGTGKTPAVIALAEEAKRRGFKPCILTRGYRGKTKAPCLTIEDKEPFLNTYAALEAKYLGDEPILMTYRLKGIPVVVGKNRYLSGMSAIGELGPDALNMFILDDGFQHWALYRDVDVLLIDATNPFGNNRLFPEGILREPLKAIQRADIIILTKTDAVSGEHINVLSTRVRGYNPDAPLYTAFHKPTSFINLNGIIKDIEFINKKRIYAFSGITNHAYFKTTLNSIGAEIVEFKSFRDHYFYRQQDIDRIIEAASGLEIITTEKDIAKLRGLKLSKNISALMIEFSIDEAFYNNIFSIIFKKDV